MNPEQRIQQLEDELKALKRMILEMQTSNSISPDFKATLSRSVVTSNAKTAASETQAVDEGGAATYNVAKPMDGFVTIGGYNIPYYS